MAVSRTGRDHLIDVINRYGSGKIKSDRLDEELDQFIGHKDTAIRELSTFLWCTYDDFKDHTLYPDAITLLRLKRMVAFLATDLEYQHRGFSLMPILNKNQNILKPFWPFESQSQWRTNCHLESPFQKNENALIASFVRSTATR